MPDPISTAMVVTTSGIAAKKLIEKLVEDTYSTVKHGLGIQMRKWKAASHADSVYKRVRQLRMVKTIWQMEKEVDLTKFYFPSKVKIEDRRVAVHLVENFGYDGSILIEGTVGQGKSIFLRYLASQDILVSKRIPVFIELRRMRAGQSLVAAALQELTALGFEMTEDVFQHLASVGRLVLMLDAFDELKDELKSDLISELETLLRQHEKLRAIVTSRPDSGIATSPMLRIFQLCPLEGKEYEEIIRRMSHDTKSANAIIAGVRKEGTDIARVLDTPLMVALLLVRYRIDQTLPENASAFYGALFMLLLQRHDKNKGGYVRPRRSGLTDNDLADFFNALSYLTRKSNETSFKRAQAIHFAKDALALVGKAASPEKVLGDIVEITCLLLMDADECKYIHRNIQEYHAALFIRDQPDTSAISFYSAMDTRWKSWRQELKFLEALDRYRFLKHFHIPQIRSLLGITGKTPDSYQPDRSLILQVCGKDEVTLTKNELSITYYATGAFWPSSYLIHSDIDDYVSGVWSLADRNLPDTIYTIEELLAEPLAENIAKACCEGLFTVLFKCLETAEEFVSLVDTRKLALEF